MVTTRTGIGLAVAVADCLPIGIVLGDAIAVVHAGWRSLAAGVIESTMLALQRAAGSSGAVAGAGPFAVIGPSLGPCCFEIGEEVAAKFPASSLVRKDASSRPHLDARADAKRRLQARGAAVDVIDLCTRDDARLFSHRAGGIRSLGRQVLLLQRSAIR
jgi:copper oxidase (laccase) domain-containing protein